MTVQTTEHVKHSTTDKKPETGSTAGSTGAPDGGWGWVVVLGSFMIHFIVDGIIFSFGVFVQPLLEHFDATRVEVGWLGSILIGVSWGSGPLASTLTNMFGCRVMTIIGTFIAAGGLVATIFAPNIWFMYASLGIVAGFGLGLVYLPSIITVSYYFDRKRSCALGLAVCGSGIGTFVFAPFTNLLIDEYGWRATFIIHTGLLLNCLVCGAVFRPLTVPVKYSSAFECSRSLPEKQNGRFLPQFKSPSISSVHQDLLSSTERLYAEPKQQQLVPKGRFKSSKYKHQRDEASSCTDAHNQPIDLDDIDIESNLRYTSDETPSTSNVSLPDHIDTSSYTASQTKNSCSLLSDAVFALFAVSNALTCIGFCVPFIFVPDRAIQQGITEDQAAILISVIGIANTLGRIIFGYIADFACVNRLDLFSTNLVLCGISSVLSVFCSGFAALVAYCFLFGLFIGIFTCLSPIVLVDLVGLSNLTNAFGILMLFGGVGAVLGPPCAGWLYDTTNNYDYSFYMMGAAVTVSGVMLYFIPCIHKCQTHFHQRHLPSSSDVGKN